VRKLVWDTFALINLKEGDSSGYSPAHSLWKDLSDGWIDIPYQNIIPAIAAFEIPATVSRVRREGGKMLHEFYIMGDNEILYPIDQEFVYAANAIVTLPGFDKLRGADLIFACIAKLEDAWLITLDKGFAAVSGQITVVDLNESRREPKYRSLFDRS